MLNVDLHRSNNAICAYETGEEEIEEKRGK